jgi:hypothetical protein
MNCAVTNSISTHAVDIATRDEALDLEIRELGGHVGSSTSEKIHGPGWAAGR